VINKDVDNRPRGKLDAVPLRNTTWKTAHVAFPLYTTIHPQTRFVCACRTRLSVSGGFRRFPQNHSAPALCVRFIARRLRRLSITKRQCVHSSTIIIIIIIIGNINNSDDSISTLYKRAFNRISILEN